LGKPLAHLLAIRLDGEVGGEHFDSCARFVVEFGRQRFQAFDVTRDEHQIVAVDGVTTGESRAKAGRRPGDQCDGAWHARQVTQR
jgi:hypothetical protein